MKEVYKELSKILGNAPVIELKETEKAKELKANLFVKMDEASWSAQADLPEAGVPAGGAQHEIVTDRRIKVFVADIDAFGIAEKAARLLRTHIPDLKIFAAGADMTNIPEICTGFLQTDPETALFTARFMKEQEGLSFDSKAAATLGAAIELAKNSSYTDYNILAYLQEQQI